MITTANSRTSILWQTAPAVAAASPRAASIWTEAYAWLALLPTLFITASGRIQADSGPVAFRFTAMEEDSLARRITRLGCSMLILYLLSSRLREIGRACRRAKLLLLLPLLAFLSVFWSQNPSHTLVDALNLALTTLFAIYLFVRYPGRRLIEFLAFAAAISLLLSMVLVVVFPGAGIDSLQQNAWRGIFGQRNNCAVVCTLFFAVGLHYRSHSLIDQAARGLVLSLSMLFIVMSASRTGWLLTALAILLTCGLRLLARAATLDRIVLVMAITIPIALAAYAVAANFNAFLAILDKDPTMTQRTIIWAEVVPSIVKQPLQGYGYSSFWAGLNGESMQTVLTTGWMEGQAQDGYLDVLLELGVIGLVPLVWLFLRAFGQAAKAMERRQSAIAVLLAMVLLPLILVENIGESSFLMPLGIPWFYAILCFLILSFSRDRLEAF